MAANRIMRQWESFHAAVIPYDAPAVQIVEMRRAFFAGVNAMLAEMSAIAGSGVSEEAGVIRLEEINRELTDFSRGVSAGEF